VYWKDAAAWSDVRLGGLFGTCLVVSGIIFLAFFLYSKVEGGPQFSVEHSAPVTIHDTEADVLIEIKEPTLQFIQRAGRKLFRGSLSPGQGVSTSTSLFTLASECHLYAPVIGSVRVLPLSENAVMLRGRLSGEVHPSQLATATFQPIAGMMVAIAAERRTALRVLGGCIGAAIGLVFAAGLITSDFFLSNTTGIRYTSHSVQIAWLILSLAVVVCAWATRFALRDLKHYSKELLTHTIDAASVRVIPIDRRKEFEDEIDQDVAAQRALAVFDLPPRGWTLDQAAFRKEHLTSIYTLDGDDLCLDAITEAFDVLSAVKRRHPALC
jgi:hypothetical protein